MADGPEVDANPAPECECTKAVKVHITFASYGEEDGPPVQSEWLWATPTETPGHFRLESIPFFADFGYQDIVRCEAVEWGGQHIEHEIMGIVQPSGNLTTRLFFKVALTNEQRLAIEALIEAHEGVGMEWANECLAAVSIPPKQTAPTVLGHWVKTDLAVSDLFTYTQDGTLLQ